MADVSEIRAKFELADGSTWETTVPGRGAYPVTIWAVDQRRRLFVYRGRAFDTSGQFAHYRQVQSLRIKVPDF